MVDTNSNPKGLDYVIPANDDASKSIEKVLGHVTGAIAEGLTDRKVTRDKATEEKKVKETPEAQTPAAE